MVENSCEVKVKDDCKIMEIKSEKTNLIVKTTSLTMHIVSEYISPGDTVVDCTMGNGYDTLSLAEAVGCADGRGAVYAFDIQQEAVDSTNALLAARGLRAEVHLDSHSNMANYAEPETVDCIVFNLGWLPGGDHRIFTHADTSFAAISAGLELLKKGGLMCVTIYHGGATGFEERDTLLELLREIDSDRFQVISTFFHNWKKEPPIPIFIYKYTDSERD